jgi:hypothetical protein
MDCDSAVAFALRYLTTVLVLLASALRAQSSAPKRSKGSHICLGRA